MFLESPSSPTNVIGGHAKLPCNCPYRQAFTSQILNSLCKFPVSVVLAGVCGWLLIIKWLEGVPAIEAIINASVATRVHRKTVLL